MTYELRAVSSGQSRERTSKARGDSMGKIKIAVGAKLEARS
jgi:hypothetical protein